MFKLFFRVILTQCLNKDETHCNTSVSNSIFLGCNVLKIQYFCSYPGSDGTIHTQNRTMFTPATSGSKTKQKQKIPTHFIVKIHPEICIDFLKILFVYLFSQYSHAFLFIYSKLDLGCRGYSLSPEVVPCYRNMAMQSWIELLTSSKKTALIHDGKSSRRMLFLLTKSTS